LGDLARPVLVFGAGHVGLALAGVMAPLPFVMQWYDSRPEFARPGVHIADEDGLIAAIEAAPPHAAVLIMTHDHGLDYRLTRAALGCDLALVGVIGSATKRARFLSAGARWHGRFGLAAGVPYRCRGDHGQGAPGDRHRGGGANVDAGEQVKC
jgi:hypothetical protein